MAKQKTKEHVHAIRLTKAQKEALSSTGLNFSEFVRAQIDKFLVEKKCPVCGSNVTSGKCK